mmetsp:Transcript_46302/g.110202  ORF Transcript_46302/g.110202 Transcript_46302/m.110202 type:complete len:217 (-) Transcript_46302:639-1289(-)
MGLLDALNCLLAAPLDVDPASEITGYYLPPFTTGVAFAQWNLLAADEVAKQLGLSRWFLSNFNPANCDAVFDRSLAGHVPGIWLGQIQHVTSSIGRSFLAWPVQGGLRSGSCVRANNFHRCPYLRKPTLQPPMTMRVPAYWLWWQLKVRRQDPIQKLIVFNHIVDGSDAVVPASRCRRTTKAIKREVVADRSECEEGVNTHGWNSLRGSMLEQMQI